MRERERERERRSRREREEREEEERERGNEGNGPVRVHSQTKCEPLLRLWNPEAHTLALKLAANSFAITSNLACGWRKIPPVLRCASFASKTFLASRFPVPPFGSSSPPGSAQLLASVLSAPGSAAKEPANRMIKTAAWSMSAVQIGSGYQGCGVSVPR